MPAPAPWVISDAIPGDAAELVALDQRNFPREDWFDRRLWRRILGEQAARGQMLTLVARQQGTVVGAIVGEFRPRAGRVLVWSIAVDTRERGAGLAQQLMAELVQRTPATYHQVGLDVRRDNLRARRFYERLGFRPVREIPNGYPDGTDAIRYQLSLDMVRRAPPQAGRSTGSTLVECHGYQALRSTLDNRGGSPEHSHPDGHSITRRGACHARSRPG